MDKGGTNTNRLKDKDDDVHGLTSERWHRLYVLRKERRRLISIEDNAED